MTTAPLRLRIGQHSRAGRKTENQDSLGVRYPEGEALTLKGVAAVIADGVSASLAGREAAETCVKGFLHDYYSTPDSWRAETAISRVLGALNRWLHGRGHALHGSEQGMVCTLSGLVIKSNTAYVFHVGDSRVYLLRQGQLECLTQDHQITMGPHQHALTRAMGIDLNIEIDMLRVTLEKGDRFLLTTDGVHNHVTPAMMSNCALIDNPESAARTLVELAFDHGSKDNLSAQVLEVGALPADDLEAHYRRLTALPFPPPLEPGHILDGYRVVRELHASKRSQVYHAVSEHTGDSVVIKTPSPNYEDDAAYIDRFMTEAWVARRVDNPHVLRFLDPPPHRSSMYCLTEYVKGPTLRSWMNDHPRPALAEVRDIVCQIAIGLRALHRLEMIHQDLKPENVVIDGEGTVKIIDLGAVRIRGIEQIGVPWDSDGYLGTESYAAPELLEGASATAGSDRYALGVIAYELLTGQLPYSHPPFPSARKRLRYRSARQFNPEVPAWLDGCLEKAVSLNPVFRYESLSEFLRDLTHPNPKLAPSQQSPLADRVAPENWRFIATLSLLLNLILLIWALSTN